MEESFKTSGIFTAEDIKVECNRGHKLEPFKTPGPGYSCDNCAELGKSEVLPTQTLLYGCKPCGWDACADCYNDLYQQQLLVGQTKNEKEEDVQVAEGSEEEVIVTSSPQDENQPWFLNWLRCCY